MGPPANLHCPRVLARSLSCAAHQDFAAPLVYFPATHSQAADKEEIFDGGGCCCCLAVLACGVPVRVRVSHSLTGVWCVFAADEIEDGMAEGAKKQAAIWAQAFINAKKVRSPFT